MPGHARDGRGVDRLAAIVVDVLKIKDTGLASRFTSAVHLEKLVETNIVVVGARKHGLVEAGRVNVREGAREDHR